MPMFDFSCPKCRKRYGGLKVDQPCPRCGDKPDPNDVAELEKAIAELRAIMLKDDETPNQEKSV